MHFLTYPYVPGYKMLVTRQIIVLGTVTKNNESCLVNDKVFWYIVINEKAYIV